MANKKISQLPAAGTLAGNELVEVVQGGANKQTTSGALGGQQVICTTDANPNTAGIVPGNKQAGAIFYQDPTITLFNEWRWSPVGQVWVQKDAP